MKQEQPPRNEVTTELGFGYPICRQGDGELIRLRTADPKRRYALTANVQTGLTFYREFSEDEEVFAEMAKAEWEAKKAQREMKETKILEYAEKFECALQYKQKLVAFLDLLGWSNRVEATAEKDEMSVKVLGNTLAELHGFVRFTSSLRNLNYDGEWPGDPVMTYFSDSVVFSANDDEAGKQALLQMLQVLSSNLIAHGFLLRGGIEKGLIYHD